MIKSRLLLLVSFFVLCAIGCNSAKKNEEKRNESGVLMQDDTMNDGVQKMQTSNITNTIDFKGKTYHSTITRTPDELLPKVESEMGETYADNRVVLNITCDGKTFYNKTFTKNDFSAAVESSFLKKAILEGFVYNKTTPQGILYAASICYPQTDLYIPISILISPDGKMTYTKDELLEDIYDSQDNQ